MMSQKKVLVFKGSKELRAKLPRGAISSLAKKYDVSWTFIHLVAVGKSPTRNENLMKDIIDLGRIEEENRKKISKII
jgi:hypothetical protein